MQMQTATTTSNTARASTSSTITSLLPPTCLALHPPPPRDPWKKRFVMWLGGHLLCSSEQEPQAAT